MRVFSLFPTQTSVVLACDVVLSILLYLSMLLLASASGSISMVGAEAWMRVSIAVLSVLGGLYFNGLYTDLRVTSRVSLGLRLSHVFGLSLVLQTVVAFIYPNAGLPRRVVLLGTVTALPAFFLWRLAYSAFLWKLFGLQSVLLVGSGSLAQDLAHLIAEKSDRGIQLIGYVGTPVSEALLPGTYLGAMDQLSAITTECKPDRIVVACSQRRDGGMPVEELLKLRHRAIPIEEGASLYETLSTRICSREFRPADFIFDDTLVHRPGSLALQSIYINLLALAGIILLSPVLVILAVLVAISTGGPITEQISCIGYRGIPFTLNRFRIAKMVPGKNRTTITPIGRFLRGTHLDLLPALFNLLRGEMALVGPSPNRAEVAEDLTRRIPFYEQRYSLRPGLTGWSQINMETKSGPADALVALEYDLYYLKNMSLSLDAYILLHQLRNIFSFGF